MCNDIREDNFLAQVHVQPQVPCLSLRLLLLFILSLISCVSLLLSTSIAFVQLLSSPRTIAMSLLFHKFFNGFICPVLLLCFPMTSKAQPRSYCYLFKILRWCYSHLTKSDKLQKKRAKCSWRPRFHDWDMLEAGIGHGPCTQNSLFVSPFLDQWNCNSHLKIKGSGILRELEIIEMCLKND